MAELITGVLSAVIVLIMAAILVAEHYRRERRRNQQLRWLDTHFIRDWLHHRPWWSHQKGKALHRSESITVRQFVAIAQLRDWRLCQLRSSGYQPQYGARELKRQIRLEVETFLARKLLGEAFKSGNTVRLAFDATVSQVSITPVDSPPSTKQKPRKIETDEHAEDVAWSDRVASLVLAAVAR
jgi:ABC-type uncharacterized transport system fused permease/ATPase subunit